MAISLDPTIAKFYLFRSMAKKCIKQEADSIKDLEFSIKLDSSLKQTQMYQNIIKNL